MKLAEAFRGAIESVGLEKVNHKCFWNIVKDLHNVSAAQSFLWNTLVRQEYIDKFLELCDSEEEVNQYINKTCYNTGFDLDNVKSLLSALHEGILCSYYGIYPKKNSLKTIKIIYKNNKTLWYERVKEFQEGYIIACKDNKYGVLSVRKEIMPFKYRGATMFSNGLACFNDGSSFGFINIMGNLEIDLDHFCYEGLVRSVGPFSHGIAKIFGRNNKIGYMNPSGNYTDCIYDNSYDETRFDKLKLISINGLKGLINEDCKVIVQPQFTYISDNKYGNKFLLAQSANQDWFIVKESGDLQKIPLTHPTIICQGIIQEIRLYGSNVKFEFYNSSLNKVTNLHIDGVESNGDGPILLHSREGLYFFMTVRGIVFNPNGYEMAFPFVSDFTWVKVGIEWRRLNRDGDVVALMADGEILTKEIHSKVLRRNKNTSLVEIYNCDQNTTERSIPNSSYAVLSEIHGRISALNSYQSQINGKFCLWSDGNLIESMNPILRCKLSKRNTYVTKITDLSFELFYNGMSLGVFFKKNVDDTFFAMYSMGNGDDIVYYKTKAGAWYLYNINTKTYSPSFTAIEFYSVKDRVAKSIIARVSGGQYVLLDSNFKIIAEYDEIKITSSRNYFRIMKNTKYGLITYSGKTVIEPVYDSLNYYTLH